MPPPSPFASFSLMMQFVRLASPSSLLLKPPPPDFDVFFVIVTPLIVTLPPLLKMPPQSSDVFSVTTPPVVSFIVPSLPTWMPPPLPLALFFEIVPPFSFSVPCT